jgi:hypothetical protein
MELSSKTALTSPRAGEVTNLDEVIIRFQTHVCGLNTTIFCCGLLTAASALSGVASALLERSTPARTFIELYQNINSRSKTLRHPLRLLELDSYLGEYQHMLAAAATVSLVAGLPLGGKPHVYAGDFHSGATAKRSAARRGIAWWPQMGDASRTGIRAAMLDWEKRGC